MAIAGPAPWKRRTQLTLGFVLACFLLIGGQLIRLALKAQPDLKISLAEPLVQSWSRPDILDRHGRLLATDVAVHSLYADPQLIEDLDETVEKLSATLSGLETSELRKALGDKGRRFAWIARGLSPRQAQRVHGLGLPGVAFRMELRRAYPLGALAGHLLGAVNVDNKGLAGLERVLDETGKVEPVQGATRAPLPPVRLSLDIGVQHALADELKQATLRHSALAAAGLVLDVRCGEVLAAVSLPQIDPSHPAELVEAMRADRLTAGAYELGSVFKTITVAMALEAGVADLDTIYDVRQPLTAGSYIIKDLHMQNRPLSVREIFLHSSNIGAGMLALAAGSERQQAFLEKLGLLTQIRWDGGAVAPPLLPKHWGRAETITVAYGHGIAVSPLQFAAAVTPLINGGYKISPTLTLGACEPGKTALSVSAATSSKIREIMRLNVTNAAGTGRRAEAAGYRVGGKTGTAEMPSRGGYQEKAVISSFVGAFPMDEPQYLTFVLLFEPEAAEGVAQGITGGLNAAPTTARIVERVAPLLGVLPRLAEAHWPEGSPFDALPAAQ